MIPWKWSILALALAVSGCGDDLSGCGDNCPQGTACDQGSGLCVEVEKPDVSHADLSPVSNALVTGGLLHAAVFDRLRRVVLYGVEAGPGQPLLWESAAMVSAEPWFAAPRLKLLDVGDSPAVLFERSPGVVALARKTGLAWVSSEVTDFDGPLSWLDGIRTADSGIHFCVADAWGALSFGTIGDNGVGAIRPVQAPSQQGVPAAPCAVARMGGKTTLLTFLSPVGLAAVSLNTDGSWKADMIDPAAAPVTVGWLPTSGGLLVAWVDGKDGAARVASGSSGVVAVQEAGSHAVLPGALPYPMLVKVCLGADSGTENRPYVGYFSHTRSLLEVRRLSVKDTWDSAVEHPFSVPFVPSVVFQRDGRPVVAGIETGTASGQVGSFRVLAF